MLRNITKLFPEPLFQGTRNHEKPLMRLLAALGWRGPSNYLARDSNATRITGHLLQIAELSLDVQIMSSLISLN